MPYTFFTEAQKRQANEVDLAAFLTSQGEKLISSGRDYRLSSDRSITIRGNRWYDHAAERGGYPVDFLRFKYNCSYPEAVEMLAGRGVLAPLPKAEQLPVERTPFVLPAPNQNMRRVYAYLTKTRCIGRDVVTHFVHAKTLYEDAKYHNAVFVGRDEKGVPRHAHKRSTNSEGAAFRINIESSNPAYSFHHIGVSESMFVFEAPIDLMSFATIYPENWQQHSYVALCGTSSHAMVNLLERCPNIRYVGLCLDNDTAGVNAANRLSKVVAEHHCSSRVLLPERKDWNEDLMAVVQGQQFSYPDNGFCIE